MQTHAPSRPSLYPFVDVLRALTAACYHMNTAPALLMRIGWTSVDCFFAISGFVTTLSALKDRQWQPAGYWLQFWLSRSPFSSAALTML